MVGLETSQILINLCLSNKGKSQEDETYQLPYIKASCIFLVPRIILVILGQNKK